MRPSGLARPVMLRDGVQRAVRSAVVLVACGVALAFAAVASVPGARADTWLPHPAGATWQYRWSDSTYNPSGTVENVVVQQTVGPLFTLAWADTADQPPSSSSTALVCPSGTDMGTMTFEDTSAGLLTTDWNSCPPPSNMPVLCASSTNCANSLAGAFYNVIWGSREPLLSEPLLRGLSWNATGGAADDVAGGSEYLGLQVVRVPAFPAGVVAAAIRTNISQNGALGDPYGSGVRTTWWVDGVGPVRVTFQHAGAGGPVTNVDLLKTSLTPVTPAPDADYFPLVAGMHGTYRWTNRKHLQIPEVQRLSVDAAVNRTARVSVRSVSGPIRESGQYVFSTRLSGVTNTSGTVSAASVAKLPKLGHGRHFFTVVDLMTFGFNPLLPAYPVTGSSWHSGNARDLAVYGVRGSTRIVGIRRVRVPAGTFSALEVQSTLTQPGHRFGSGVRTMWLAPRRGLVKLVFAHRDGSTSQVVLVK